MLLFSYISVRIYLIRILPAGKIYLSPSQSFLFGCCSVYMVLLHDNFIFSSIPMLVTSFLILIPIFMVIFDASLKVLISQVWNADTSLSDSCHQSFQFQSLLLLLRFFKLIQTPVFHSIHF